MQITIRPLEEKDAYTSWKWRNDPEVFAKTGRRYSGPVTLEDELNWISTVLGRSDERRFAILAEGKYIGNVYLTDITQNEAEIGIFIGNKNYWKKGVATKTYKLIFDYAFKSLNINNIKSIIRIENEDSIKLHEKMGFMKTGKDIECFYYIKYKNK